LEENKKLQPLRRRLSLLRKILRSQAYESCCEEEIVGNDESSLGCEEEAAVVLDLVAVGEALG